MLLISCGQSKSERTTSTISETTVVNNVIDVANTGMLKETSYDGDVLVNDYLKEKLQQIRKNFKRINSITNWTSIDTKELSESSEGGEVKFYYQNEKLEKLVTHHYGEMGQLLTEYYLLNGQLSFVFEKSYKYKRPLYYDATLMKSNNDAVVFDLEKSEVTEYRSYFDNRKLVHQISNHDNASPLADEYLLEEEKRIKTNFNEVIKQTKK